MARLVFVVPGALLLFVGYGLFSGCDAGGGATDTLTLPADAGPDAVLVNLDGGGPPITPPDGKAACPAGICNYQTGSGCSGAASACIPSLSGTTATPACSPPGTVQPGAACAQATDCTAGHICGGGACRKMCCGGDWTGCDSAAEHCIENLSYDVMGTVVHTGAMLCFPVNTCDVLAQMDCDQPGTACQLADATGATACLPAGTGTSGSPCPCKGGFACVEPAGKSPVCVRLCKAVPGGGDPYCQTGEGICTHYNRDPPGVGECQPP